MKINTGIIENNRNDRPEEINTEGQNLNTRNRGDLWVIIYLASILLCSFILVVRDDYTYLSVFGLDYQISFICPFKFVTRHDCPFCGMTRCFVSLSHLDFASAIRYNAAGILAYVLCILEIIFRAVKIVSQNCGRIIKPMEYMRKALFVLMLAVAMVDWIITF